MISNLDIASLRNTDRVNEAPCAGPAGALADYHKY